VEPADRRLEAAAQHRKPIDQIELRRQLGREELVLSDIHPVAGGAHDMIGDSGASVRELELDPAVP
jgi:hypothetical protein